MRPANRLLNFMGHDIVFRDVADIVFIPIEPM